MVDGRFSAGMAKKIIGSRNFLIIFSLLAGIFTPVAVMSAQIPDKDSGGSLTLAMLNSEMNIGQYFQGDTTVTSADKMNWYLKVNNGMNEPEYVAIKIKLLNSASRSPDDSSHTPSPAPEILIMRQTIPAHSAWVTSLNWTIANAGANGGDTVIKSMIINGKWIDNLDIRSQDGKNFRIVIELWKYDTNAGDFAFAWSSSSETRSVWNQIWFNVES